ncbi:autotransporter-associated beta strand repeat-containing protein, partial [Pararobbsia alpina]|uniref:autotransporter-associated beta strand repeat-containing protein n=1 Tax=Pararobbsia alpina TaxID=621374 RepID=UPI0015835FDE
MATQPALAQQAVWTGPFDGSWFTAGNWSTGQIPNASTDVVVQNGMPVINADGAQAASVSVSSNSMLTMNGANIGALGHIFGGSQSVILFTGASSAGNAAIELVGAEMGTYDDATAAFYGTSTASSAVMSTANQAQIGFYEATTAGQASISSHDGGLTTFRDNSSAGTAHISNNSGGLTAFFGDSSADTATLVNNAGGTLDISQMSQSLRVGSLSGAGNVYLGASNLAVGGLNQDDVIAGVISDSVSPQLTGLLVAAGSPLPPSVGGSLTKAGTGTLTLAGQNTYTGGTSLNGGVVQVSADENLGAATGPLSFNGGTLRTTADMTMSRATTLDTGGGTIDTMPGTQLTQNGVIGGTGALTKAGTGTLTLAGQNTYAGGTSLDGGVVQISADENLGAATGPLSFNGGTLRTTADMTMSRATTLDTGGGTIDTMPGTQLTQNGTIGGTGALTKIGTGTLTLAGQNTYAGGTSLDGGVVQVSADANLGAATGPLSFNGGTLRTTADMTMSRATALDTGGGTIDTMPGTQLTQNGTIGGTGVLTKAGTGTLVLSAANVYTGGTSLNGGVVQVSSDANLGAATGPLSFNGGTLRTTADMTMSRATTLDTGGGTIDTMPATQLTQNGAIDGTGALTKAGTGTLTLAGQNTYTGGTSL